MNNNVGHDCKVHLLVVYLYEGMTGLVAEMYIIECYWLSLVTLTPGCVIIGDWMFGINYLCFTPLEMGRLSIQRHIIGYHRLTLVILINHSR